MTDSQPTIRPTIIPPPTTQLRRARQATIVAYIALFVAIGAAAAMPVTASAAWNQPVEGVSPINFGNQAGVYAGDLASIEGIPYITWAESDGARYQIRVRRLNDGQTEWEHIGFPESSPINFSPLRHAGEPSLASVGGRPHVAWSEDDGTNFEIRVSRLSVVGDAWESIAPGVSPINHANNRDARDPSLADIGGVPHVAWSESDGTNTEIRVSRLKADGSWEQLVGGASPINHAADRDATDPELIEIEGEPWVAWHEKDGTNTEVRVSRLNAAGTDWQEVVGGASPINHAPDQPALSISLANVGGAPYVAWSEVDAPTSAEIRVSRLNAAGTAWQQVVGGASPINHSPNGAAFSPSLFGIGDAPYVAWVEQNPGIELRVSRLNTAGADWEQVVGGASPIKDSPNGSPGQPSLSAVGGVPYVAWSESGQLRVSRLEPDFSEPRAETKPTGATLETRVRTYGVDYPIGFELGEDSNFGLRTPTQVVGSSSEAITVSQEVGSLSPESVYVWRPFATDGVRRTASGPIRGLATPAAPDPVDATAPETKIDKGPKRKTRRRRAAMRFSADEAGARFECRLDRGKFKPCGSPRRLMRLRRGKHRFAVRAIDAAGNVDATPATWRWKVVRKRR